MPDPTVFDLPLAERLNPEGAFHGELLARLRARIDLAQRHMSTRYDQWDQVDEHCRLYIDLARKAKKADRTVNPDKLEVPFERAIVIPASLAIGLVRLTQLVAIFSSRSPQIQLEGRGPEDVRPAKLMESTLAYDQEQTNALLTLYALCQDADKYGLGVTYDTWEQEAGWKILPPKPVPPALDNTFGRALLGMTGFRFTSSKSWGVLREFNRWESVDPFHYWPDPRVPVSDVQNGEFAGHRTFRGAMHLKERGQDVGGPYFNLEYLGRVQGGGSTSSRVTAGQTGRRATSRDRFSTDEFSLRGSPDPDDKGFFSVDHLQVKLIPKDWQLAETTQPEIWWFTLVDETLIVRAHPSEYAHGKFTYSVGESLPDPHALQNPGMIENLDGLQRVITWLINSHIENVRKHLNDVLIYSTTYVEEADILNPGPARHIRLTQAGEQAILDGRVTSPLQLIAQLPFVDITKAHLPSSRVLMDMMQQLAATSDPQMSSTTKDKRTLGEVQQVLASSSQRLAITARLIDAMAIQPSAQRMIANRQQFTSMEQFVRITGDLAKEAGTDRLMIRPTDLAGDFDYIPHTGVVPPDPSRMVGTWTQILMAVGKIPQLLAPRGDGKQLSLHEIFNEAVRVAGVKNIEQFYEAMQVTPDQMVAAALARGDMVPTSEVVNGRVQGAGIRTPVVQGADLTNGAPQERMAMP